MKPGNPIRVMLLFALHPNREFATEELSRIMDADRTSFASSIRELRAQGWLANRMETGPSGRWAVWRAGPLLLRFLDHCKQV